MDNIQSGPGDYEVFNPAVTGTNRFILQFPAKQIRAHIIAAYMRQAGYRGAVVFGCGNGARALRSLGIVVLDIGSNPKGDLQPNRWWQPADIHFFWPNLFDATSGHLPIPLMVEIAEEYKRHFGNWHPKCIVYVPTGSGETITCLRWAYPKIDFMPLRFENDPATQYDKEAPLNMVVRAMNGYAHEEKI